MAVQNASSARRSASALTIHHPASPGAYRIDLDTGIDLCSSCRDLAEIPLILGTAVNDDEISVWHCVMIAMEAQFYLPPPPAANPSLAAEPLSA